MQRFGKWVLGLRGLRHKVYLVDHVLRRLLLDERLPVATRLGRMQRHHPAFANCRSTLQVCFLFILFAEFAHLASLTILRIRLLSLPSVFSFPEVQLFHYSLFRLSRIICIFYCFAFLFLVLCAPFHLLPSVSMLVFAIRMQRAYWSRLKISSCEMA